MGDKKKLDDLRASLYVLTTISIMLDKDMQNPNLLMLYKLAVKRVKRRLKDAKL